MGKDVSAFILKEKKSLKFLFNFTYKYIFYLTVPVTAEILPWKHLNAGLSSQAELLLYHIS